MLPLQTKPVLDKESEIQNYLAVDQPRTSRLSSLPRSVQVAWLVLICLFPTWFVIQQYRPNHGFTKMIFFGQHFLARSLPEVREAKVYSDSPAGYDGQFYAQMAMDPLFLRPDLPKTMDSAPFRAQRPILPMLSYVIGLGNPFYIIEVYAVLNLVFWYLLLVGLLYYLKARSLRDYLCITAILFGHGVITSIDRALTDLPAAVFGFYGLVYDGLVGGFLIACSILTKPTSLFFALPYLGLSFSRNVQYLLRWALIVLIPCAWLLYIKWALGSMAGGGGDNFSWPGLALGGQILLYFNKLSHYPTLHPDIIVWLWHLFDLASLLSLVVQVLYFATHRNFRCKWWWLGACFSVLFLFLSGTVLNEQMFIRVVIPLTMAFNLSLGNETTGVFRLYFIPGNIGLMWAFLLPILIRLP